MDEWIPVLYRRQMRRHCGGGWLEDTKRAKVSEFDKLIMRWGEEATAEVRNTICQRVSLGDKVAICARISEGWNKEDGKENY